MSLLPIIQSLWIGGELSKIEQLSIASFVKNGHEFHLYTYGDVKGIPEGTIIKDANTIIPESEIFTYSKGSYAGFADWFRWKLLLKKGGFWIDTDVVCIKPFNFDSELIFGLESKKLACPAVMSFPKGHEICSFLEENCRLPNKELPYDKPKDKRRKLKRKLLGQGKSHIKWGETGGPEGFTRALKHFDLFKLSKPFTYFFPIHHSNWNSFYDTTLKNDLEFFNDTYAIHLWNEMTRRSNFDKNATFDSNSLVEQLKRKYL